MGDDDECFDAAAAVTDLKANYSKHGPYSSPLLLMDLLMQQLQRWQGRCNGFIPKGRCNGFIPISITKNTISTTIHAHTLLDEYGDEDNHNQNVQWLWITRR